MEKKKEFIGVGRRKRAISSVRIRPGSGNINVNGKKIDEYFVIPEQREIILSPLHKLDMNGKYDIIIRSKGGGVQGQVIAARPGIARALVEEDQDRRSILKSEGFLTRDPRKRERKKYGLAGARKSFQFSKR